MIQIPLTKGLYATIDEEDYEYVSRFKWRAFNNGYTNYAVRSDRASNRMSIYMHRELLGDPERPNQVDHINRNGLDNRRKNIRVVTPQENQRNKGPQKNNIYSLRQGVTYHKLNKKWQAQMQIDKKNVYIGSFSTEREAIEARENFEWGLIVQ